MATKPVCKAILLCDQAILEHGTHKLSLVGIFDSFFVGQGQATVRATAFLQITDAVGNYKLAVEIEDLATGDVVARSSSSEIAIDDPLLGANVIIPIPRLPLHPGEYDLVVRANEDEIDRQKFKVALRGE